MIALTQAQQAIVKSDLAMKSFRVHFPNGELSDLTNEDIVFESVRFQESVCSEQTFRFGRVEASTIEFETVGAPNMLGATIECSMTYTLGDESVTIPYGTFKVDSCQRDHTEMTHRKVQAFSDCAWYAKRSFEYFKSTIPRYVAQTYNPNIDYMVGSLSSTARSLMTETQLTPAVLVNQSIELNGFVCEVANDPTGESDMVIRAQYQGGDVVLLDWPTKRYVMSFGYSGSYLQEADAVYKIVVPKGDDYEYFKQIVKTNAGSKGLTVISDLLTNFTSIQCTSTDEDLNISEGRVILQGSRYLTEYDDRVEMVMYPFLMRSENGHAEYLTWYFTTGIFDVGYGQRTNIGYTPFDETYAEGIEIFKTPVVYKYKITDTYLPRAMYDYTEEVNAEDATAPMYSFWNAFDMNEILQGYAESRASMVRIERGGDIAVMRLDNSSPYALTAHDVSGSAWWDEYDVAPIGTVYFTADTEDSEQKFAYTFSSDPSVYDMTDNKYFGSIVIEPVEVTAVGYMSNPNYLYLLNGDLYYYDGTAWTSAGTYSGPISVISLLLKLHFVPYAGSVTFTPLDANFRGMPYLQVGDAITLTAADGTVINSYILAQTFSGIQYIEQDVETVQGNVVGSEASY